MRQTIDRGVSAIPQVSVQLVQSTGMQPITGEHLVAPDGTVNLGTYGLVYVAGMTLEEAKPAIETHLAKYLDEPQGRRLGVRLQQQGLLRDHRRRRLGRPGGPLADHRQRDGAGRHLRRSTA